jgi:HSP20 family molecular chaperone IbpA
MGTEDSVTTIEEREDSYVIHVELKDATEDDVSMDVDEDGISVVVAGEAYAMIALPDDADVDNITSTIEQDHIDIFVPKVAAHG